MMISLGLRYSPRLAQSVLLKERYSQARSLQHALAKLEEESLPKRDVLIPSSPSVYILVKFWLRTHYDIPSVVNASLRSAFMKS